LPEGIEYISSIVRRMMKKIIRQAEGNGIEVPSTVKSEWGDHEDTIMEYEDILNG